MADITLPRSSSNNGVATPATPGSITVVTGDLIVLVITVLGTSPTIGVPAGFTQIRNLAGANLSVAIFIQPNSASGPTNPSSVLGGVVTGWIAQQFEFTATGANEGIIGSAQQVGGVASVPNPFPTSAIGLQNLLFIESVSRATQTFVAANSGLNWSISQLPQAGVQGLSTDFYWASSFAQGGGPFTSFPVGGGTLGGSVNFVEFGMWLNAPGISSAVPQGAIIEGNAGTFVPQFYQGLVGSG